MTTTEEPSDFTLFPETAVVSELPPPARERSPRKPRGSQSAAASPTTTALEWFAGIDPEAAERLARGLANLDTLLSRTGDFRTLVSFMDPWVESPLSLLRARHGACLRLKWLQSRSQGDQSVAFEEAEPTASDLTEQLIAGARGQTFVVLTRGLSEAGQAPRNALSRIQEALDEIASWYGQPGYLPGSWRAAEDKLAALLAMQKRATEKIAQLQAAASSLNADTLRPFASAVVSEFGAEALSVIVGELKGFTSTIPAISDEQRYIQHQIATVDDTVKTLPANVQATTKASLVADLQRQYDAAAAQLEHFRGQERLNEARQRTSEFESAAFDFKGWAELATLTEKHPEAFPEGFAARWLDAGHKTLQAIGTEAIWQALEAIPPSDVDVLFPPAQKPK